MNGKLTRLSTAADVWDEFEWRYPMLYCERALVISLTLNINIWFRMTPGRVWASADKFWGSISMLGLYLN